MNNYIDDTGVQVADVVVGIRELGIEPMPDEPFDQYCSRVYIAVSARYETDPGCSSGGAPCCARSRRAATRRPSFVKDLARRIVNAHLATMRRFDIAYDLLTWESDIIGLGFWRQAFELLRESGAIVLVETGKLAGCWVMPADSAEDEGDDDTKVLVKSDGIATYTAKDIAYQLWKFGLLGRDFYYVPWEDDPTLVTTSSVPQPGAPPAHFGGAQRVINVIDARQAYPQRVVQRALRRLHHEREADNSIHLSYEVVALTPAAAAELGVEIEEGRDSVALSGRRGIEVRADDLLDRAIARLSANARDAASATLVAAGAVRYYLLKFSLNQIIAFDFDEALRVTGDTGVYLQYAHARAAGILRKVSDDGAASRGSRRAAPGGARAAPQHRGVLARAHRNRAGAFAVAAHDLCVRSCVGVQRLLRAHAGDRPRGGRRGAAVPAGPGRGDPGHAGRCAAHPRAWPRPTRSEPSSGAGMIRGLRAPFV